MSAKEGRGVPELLEAVVARVPAPRGDPKAPLRALIFDSYYDRYRGAIPSIRVVDGEVRAGMHISMGSHEGTYDVAIAHSTTPLHPQRVRVANYPVTPAVRAMARQVQTSR